MSRFNPYHLPPNDPYLNIKGRTLRPKFIKRSVQYTSGDLKAARQFWKDNPVPISTFPYWLDIYSLKNGTFGPGRQIISRLKDYDSSPTNDTTPVKLPDSFVGQLLVFYYDTETELINVYAFQIADILSGQTLRIHFINPGEHTYFAVLAPDILKFYDSADSTTPSHLFDPSPSLDADITAPNVNVIIPDNLLPDVFIFSIAPSK